MEKTITTVAELMTSDVISIDPGAPIDKAEHIMRKNHFRHLPVVKGEKLVGILSLTDLQRMSFASAYNEDETDLDTEMLGSFTVDQVMNRKPLTISMNSSIQEATRILVEKEFHAIPVVDGDNLAGIITTTDLLRYFLENHQW